ncbi:winged helix-turn-helix transcriptional regulator [Luteipulveratus halotolerans]|uniref:HTH hxlR-type domain-containing protein n=1 Tax=Luteipulveratus halotolerans TaxID=1631356 RepID=A0A0L6CKL8_9MICO|nr:helix-turn-helix domain-containing protein [Luteipulveratus halotolerans]KNX38341.1 hypothetical protein VV01_16210 [Luteipulveratus halotolerans]
MSRSPQPYACGVDAAIDVISGKWKAYILWRMADGPKRFGELRRLVPGITERVLIRHLRELEADEIVLRTEFAQVPPKVEYSLTPAGVALNAALEPLADWGHERMDRIAAARQPATRTG